MPKTVSGIRAARPTAPVKAKGKRVAQPPTESIDRDAQPIRGRTGPDGKPVAVPLAEMLTLDEPEMRAIDLKVGLVRAVRETRKANGLTQAAVAARLGIARTRIAELESNSHEPTFDALIPAFFAVGGTVDQFCELVRQTDGCMDR